ncbi:MAG TPA: hypothetical protein VLG16_01045 [Candidatus Saccharimonadales bacterium]|nr:hypothetical protein [Candidatus Saccharimonadales bacterium]
MERNKSPGDAMAEALEILRQANMNAIYELIDQTLDYDERTASALEGKQAAVEKARKLIQ